MAHIVRKLSLITILLVLLLTGGCIYADHPLSPKESAKPDRNLAGLWRLECEPGDVTYFHIIISHNGDMKLVRVLHPGERSTTAAIVEDLSIFPTIIGKSHYLNVAVPVPHQENRPALIKYMFFKYEHMEGNALVVTMPSYEAAEHSIQEGTLRGKAWETTWGSNVEISDTPGKIAQWITSLTAGNGMVPYGTLKRAE